MCLFSRLFYKKDITLCGINCLRYVFSVAVNCLTHVKPVPVVRGVGPLPLLCKGSWITVMRRHNANFSFSRTWQEYKQGFGTHDADFWFGNQVRLGCDNPLTPLQEIVNIHKKKS